MRRVDPLLDVVRRHWGHERLLPYQREAMTAALERRDSLVVLPTGAGKSLCYQAPALLARRLTVVVSPLISLMKDQVDKLLSRAIPAAFLNSSLDPSDKNRVQAGIVRGEYPLVFVAPERFASDGFARALDTARVGAFAIDEAHCISHWGHDFRAEYRALGRLRKRFPGASIHAFTATATPRVRADIVEQLGLRDPATIVGDFFRPNLRYRVVPRSDAFEDARREIRARPGEAGIVYCIRRADVDDLAARLRREGIRAAPYHAGMRDEARTETQDRFAAGEVDVIVATVAFGMGIDRADVRFVIHAGMPQSLEHYQQESGRAGRDGRPADCILFYSGRDYRLWQSIFEKSAPSDLSEKMDLLSSMFGYCSRARCRHRTLVEYFGQRRAAGPCGACDVCTGALAATPDSTVLAQKILSAVVKTGQRYGPAYVAEVLRGEATERVVQRGHRELSTFGLLPEERKGTLMGWMDQMADQGLVAKEGEYGILKVTGKGWEVLRSGAEVTLAAAPRPAKAGARRGARAKPEARKADIPGALDRSGTALFERLREARRRIAAERRVPAFVVFSDRALRGIARLRPTTREALLSIRGVGPAKAADFGEAFLDVIRAGLRGPSRRPDSVRE
jgi:ATP-dependent DNA helicase RecQ